jgi:hypothetical protein
MKYSTRSFSFLIPIVYLIFSGCSTQQINSSTAPDLRTKTSSNSPTSVSSSPTEGSFTHSFFSGTWYRRFTGKYNRRPVIEVVTFGKYGSRTAAREQERRMSQESVGLKTKVPPAFKNVPSDWLPCLDSFSSNRLVEYYNNGGTPAPIDNHNPYIPFKMWWIFDLQTQNCITGLNTQKLFVERDRLKKDAHKTVATERRKVTQRAWGIQEELIQSGKVRLVSVSDRGVMSSERYFSMAHASSASVQNPGHVQGADFLLEISRHMARLLRIKNNEIVWIGSLD